MAKMPVFSVDEMVSELTPYEETLIRAAFDRKTRKLRVTKPYHKISANAEFEGSANYVWRKLCFNLVDFYPYSCIPVCADFDIPGDYDKRRAKMEVLDEMIRRAESVLPLTAQKGLMRWLGLV